MLIEKIPSFDFYDFGQLDTTQESVRKLTPKCHWIRFEVHGSAEVKTLLISADEDLDAGLSLELANTIAGRVVGQLSKKEEWNVLISPPKYSAGIAPLTLKAIEGSIAEATTELHTFRFLMKEHVYPVQLIFITEEEEHAESPRSRI